MSEHLLMDFLGRPPESANSIANPKTSPAPEQAQGGGRVF